MKFTIRRQDLQRELALTTGVVESKATIPILSHLLFRAEKGGLEILATDLEIGLRTRCNADVTGPGAATIPAKKLHDVVRALDCDVVSFESESSGWLKVEGGSFRGRVVGMPDADFPVQPEVPKDAKPLRIPLTTLQRMVSRILFAVTTENTRFAIGGALLKITGGVPTLVATDGHRLAQVSWPSSSAGGSADVTALVPRKALNELLRIRAEDENEEVDVVAAGNHVFFRTKDRVLFSRTLEGNFPSYERVLPQSNNVVARVSRTAFADTLSRVAILTSETSRMVTLAFGPSGLNVAASNPNMGEASEDVACEVSGGEVRIGLNFEYLLHFLQAVSSDAVEIRLKDTTTQALLVPTDGEGLEYRYVIMPMRLA